MVQSRRRANASFRASCPRVVHAFLTEIAQTDGEQREFPSLTSPRVDDEVGAGVDGEEEVAHVDEVVDEVVGGALVAVALEGGAQVAAHLREGEN